MTITGTTPPSLNTGLTPTFPFSVFDPVHPGVDGTASTSTSTWPSGTCCSAAASPLG
jgi:hypothetical protein